MSRVLFAAILAVAVTSQLATASVAPVQPFTKVKVDQVPTVPVSQPL